ncbi:hypothetical protein FZEAL_8365 [Fusarium zealandicum]|uniref:Peptidase S8/S53 domain-containing protein n=1 Tax=Fusarium zealandicum TaxID=1053134 RepID=A0A8H4UE17_9HYPO|nr:hypothetical protein FZEAL_8365 [Fusarium zealandicum]
MRLVDLEEWRVLQTLQPHLKIATTVAIDKLNSSRNDLSTDLKHIGYRIRFLSYELDSLCLTVSAQEDLNDDVIRAFKGEIGKLLPPLSKLFGIDAFALYRSVIEDAEGSGPLEWNGKCALSLETALSSDQHLYSSTVSALEHFNKFSETRAFTPPAQDKFTTRKTERLCPKASAQYKTFAEELLGSSDELPTAPPYITCERANSLWTLDATKTVVHEGSVFLQFGKLLVEIETGCRLAATETTKGGLPSLWLTLDKEVDEPQMQSSNLKYQDAIVGCLDIHREAYRLGVEKETEELKQSIYDKIVKNLEQDYSAYRTPAKKRRRSEFEENASCLQKGKDKSHATIQSEKGIPLCQPPVAEQTGSNHLHSEDETPYDLQTAKRTELDALVPVNEASQDCPTPPRRSRRLVQQLKQNAQTISSRIESNAKKTKSGLERALRQDSNSGGRAAMEIFDGLLEEPHDRRDVASSIQFLRSLGLFLESYLLNLSSPDPTGANDRRSSRPVKICVIDTGIDLRNPFVESANYCGRLKGLRSWKGNPTDVTDQHGHGTHIAELIFRFAPEAELYVAKITGQVSSNIPFGASRANVTQAVEWAMDQGVDIISMSFGLDTRNDELDEILNRAAVSGIILMAAAGNHGNNWPRAFPATNRNVIGIHASNGKGKDGGISPQPVPHDDNFMTLGIAISVTWENKEVIKSGTSFATPIAAAIAASVLEIARRTIPMTAQQERRLYSCEGMRQIFRLLSPYFSGGYRYVVPWSLWTQGHTKGKIQEDFLAKLDE